MQYISGDILPFLFVMQFFTFLSLYLSQAVSLPAPIGIESDLFLCTHLVQEVRLGPAVVTCRVMAPFSPAEPLHSRQAHRGETGPNPRRIARNPPSLVIGGAPGV